MIDFIENENRNFRILDPKFKKINVYLIIL